MHNLAAAESLLRLWKSFGAEWFPTTVGHLFCRGEGAAIGPGPRFDGG